MTCLGVAAACEHCHRQGALQLYWEEVGDDDVLTPREVFDAVLADKAAALSATGSGQGLELVYCRVPLTPERPPGDDDIEAILSRVSTETQAQSLLENYLTPIIQFANLGRKKCARKNVKS